MPSKLTRQQLLDNMKKEAKGASRRAKTKAASDKNPTPKEFQGADKASKRIGDKTARTAAKQTKIGGDFASPEPMDTSKMESPAKSLLKQLRGQSGIPEAPGPDVNTQSPGMRTSVLQDAAADTMGGKMPDMGTQAPGFRGAAAGAGAARTLGGIATPVGAVALAAAFASLVSGVDNPVAYYKNMLNDWHKRDDAESQNNQVISATRDIGPVSTTPIRPLTPPGTGAGAGVADAAPTASAARQVRNSATNKASSVRETGGPLSDEEILNWNRANNKNYRD